MIIKDIYNCGCRIGTRSLWRDKELRLTSQGSPYAVTIQCMGCGENTEIKRTYREWIKIIKS